MTKTPKTIAILGTGGHGWEVFSDLINRNEHILNFFGLTVDYGGSGGIWYRLQEIDNFALTRNLFGEAKPVLPWGDFNKIIMHFTTRRFGSLVGKGLDFRSNDFSDHLQNFHLLADHLALEKNITDGFEEFFRFSFNFYLDHKNKLGYKTSKKFCFGYPWQDFVFWNLGKMDDVNIFYKSHRIFPENMNIYFTALEREVLVGESKKQKYEGEHMVDSANEPILPKSLKIFNTYKKSIKADEKFLERLKRSDKIILPTGSITNWLPLINMPEVLEILKEYDQKKSLIWLVNLKKAENEMNLIDYQNFLKEKDLNPTLIIPKKYEEYTGQDEYHDFTNLNTDGTIIPALEICNQKKYTPLSISEVLQMIL